MDTVTVAYLDEPPFCVPVPDGEPAGADMDVARRVLTDADVAAIEYTLTTFSELIPGLLAGRWQMTTAMFVTPERSALIGYSRPIWAVPDGFIVRVADADRLTSYDAIAADPHAVLAVVAGQVQHQAALRAGVPSQRIIEFADQDAAADAVRRGRADASASTAIGNQPMSGAPPADRWFP
jgi:polar amino acid transport system substrate-binding protein